MTDPVSVAAPAVRLLALKVVAVGAEAAPLAANGMRAKAEKNHKSSDRRVFISRVGVPIEC